LTSNGLVSVLRFVFLGSLNEYNKLAEIARGEHYASGLSTNGLQPEHPTQLIWLI
jgi:hypothetical protein